jgi:AbrB family looped-hinge helix DNA binding protein
MTPRLKARVGPKGQAVIPKPVRDRLGIKPGDELDVREESGKVIFEKRDSRKAWQELFDLFPGKTAYPKDHDWDAEYEESYAG